MNFTVINLKRIVVTFYVDHQKSFTTTYYTQYNEKRDIHTVNLM